MAVNLELNKGEHALTLSELVVGETAMVRALGNASASYRSKLMAMGMLPGTEFTLVRVAPLGDPVEIAVRGFLLSLRKREADVMSIERVN